MVKEMNNIGEDIKLTHFAIPGCEAAVIAVCLKDSDFILEVEHQLDDVGFLVPQNQKLFWILKRLYKDGIRKFDFSVVKLEAQQCFSIDEVGGEQYVNSLFEKEVSVEHFPFYLDKLKNAFLKWRVYCLHRESASEILGNSDDSSEKRGEYFLAKAQTKFLETALKTAAKREPTSLVEGLDELVDKAIQNKGKTLGLELPFPILNERLDGLQKKKLYIITGRLKSGKSVFLLTVAAHVAFRLKIPVLMIDTEMQREEHLFRTLAFFSNVPERDIRKGLFVHNRETKERVYKTIDFLKKGPDKFYHLYLPAYTIDGLGAVVRKFKAKHDIGLFVFDYIKIPYGQESKALKEWQQLGQVATFLKDLSGELDIPILSAAQLNREADEKDRVATRMVSGSDRILQFADVGMALVAKTRKEMENQLNGDRGGNRKLQVMASRSGGETSGIDFAFTHKLVKLIEVPIQYQTVPKYNIIDDFDYDNLGLNIESVSMRKSQVFEEFEREGGVFDTSSLE